MTMTLLGAGEMIGGAIIGNIRDYVNNKAAIAANIVLLLISLALMIYINQLNEFNYVTYIWNFIWGLQDAGSNCIVLCVLGFEFDSKLIPYSVFYFL